MDREKRLIIIYLPSELVSCVFSFERASVHDCNVAAIDIIIIQDGREAAGKKKNEIKKLKKSWQTGLLYASHAAA